MSVSDKVLDAIQILTKSYIRKAGYDRTIQAQIVSCEDATIGKYRCRYQDAIIYAYSNNTDVTYTKGSSVYILVPGNDMTKEKTILGSTEKLGINYISQAEGDQAYNIIGNNCITSNQKLYLDTNNKNYKYTIYSQQSNNSNIITIDTDALDYYIKQSSSLIVGATFKTSIPQDRQVRGHYGIIYNLKFLDNTSNREVIRSYTVDEDNMVNNPYRLLYDTRQYEIFDIDGANFISLESIEIFNKDFPKAESNITEEMLITGDIEISALELCGAVRMTQEEINGVAISFYTPQGTFFIDGSTSASYKTITAQVRIKGKLASAAQNIPFYWGVENVGISTQSEYYNKYLGRGWKCLNNKNIIEPQTETQAAIIEWVPSTDTYIVKFNQATAKNNKFKVAAVYDENVITKQINIENLTSTLDLTIESNDGTKFYYDVGHPTLTCKVNGEQLANYTYLWAYESNTGLFENLPQTTDLNTEYNAAVAALQELQTAIAAGTKFANAEADNLEAAKTAIEQYKFIQRVQSNKIYDVQINHITNFSTFKCSVYNEQNIYCGTCSITLTNSLQGEDLYSLVINNGAVTFQYNENGVAPNNKSLDIQQQIQALSFTVYDNLGKPIDNDIIVNDNNCQIRWAIPIKNTMLIDKQDSELSSGTDETETYRYYDNVINLVYDIAQRYNVSSSRNQIQLTVDYKGMSLTAETDFTFIKQGEPGTNGTEYIVKLVPNTRMSNPPLWPMITKAGSVYLLNYTLPNTQENQYINESEIAINSGYQLFKAQLWHSGELVWEGMQASTPALDGITTPSIVNWEILRNKYNLTTVDDSAFSIVDAATGLISYSGDHLQSALNTPLANIIKCSITWQNKTYYGTIPIITAWTSNINFRVSLKDYTGFRYVTYTSDGISPQYDNAHPFEFICKEKINNIWEDISTVVGDHAINYVPNSNGNTKATTDGTVINANLLTLLNDSTLNLNQKRYRPSSRYNGECVNAAVTCVFRQHGATVVGRIHIPIHFLLNKYGLSNINAWDGNSIEINEDGGYILSPQMGAGVKDANNNFTGVLMGEVKTPVKNSSDIGLLGYNSGDRTFFLNSQNGSALFGKQGNGQIILDPDSDKALLYSNNFWKNYNENGLPSNYNSTNENNQGLLIDLTTPSIRYGNGKFSVNNQGVLHAEEANISGAITATSLSLGNGVTIPKESVVGLTSEITNYANSILNNFINGQYATDMESIQGQIDGNITTWFYDYEPTLNNIPASDWTTITDRTNHLGDLFYDSTTGYCYRFQSNAVDQQNPGLNDFEWVQVTDDAVAKALQAAQAAQDTADHKRRVFVQTPTPPYDIGDLWVQGGTGDIMCCRTSKQQGNYDVQDWHKASKYTDDTAVQTFINGTYSTDLQNVKNQLDQKIETWYQSTDPSTNWTTSDLRSEHEGDLWYYTGTTTTTAPILEQNSTYRWNGTSWEKQNAPKAVFDAIDGKAQVFVNQPTRQDSYSPGDLWTDGNDLWRCVSAKNAGTAFSQDDWQLATDYIDRNTLLDEISDIQQDLQEQIDAKIETFAQLTDPSINWSNDDKLKHANDLWYYIGGEELTTTKDSQNNNIKPSKTYKYEVSQSGNIITGVWTLYENVSNKTLFDLADGKSTIFYGITTDTTIKNQAKINDYLVGIDSGNTKQKGHTYKYDGTNWVEVSDYNTAITNALTGYIKEDGTIGTQIPVWESGKSYTTNKYVQYQGQIYKCTQAHTSSSNIIPTNTAYWTADTPNAFIVSNDGLLTASNAVIYGTVYASSGRFAGDVTANSLTLGQGVSIAGTNITGTLKSSNYDSSGGTAGFSANLNTGQISAPSLELSITGAATSAANSYTDSAVSGIEAAANSYTDTKFSAVPGQISTAISEIKIGGTNLLHYTADMPMGSDPLYWYTDKSNAITISVEAISHSDLPVKGVTKAIRVTNTSSSDGNIQIGERRLSGLKVGEKYSQGLWIRGNYTDKTVRLWPMYNTTVSETTSAYYQVGKITTNWQYVKVEGKTLEGAQQDWYMAGAMFVPTPAGCWFEICADKLEIGDKATDWSPNPEDYKTYVAENYSTITQTSDQISTAVSSIQIGGTNILTDSEYMTSWGRASRCDLNYGVATLHGTTDNWTALLNTSKFDADLYDGTTTYVLSFEYRSTEACYVCLTTASTAEMIQSTSYTRTKYFDTYYTLPSTNGVWTKYTFEPRTINKAQLILGSGVIVSGYFSLYARTDDVDISVRHWKWEKGTRATDWSPAPTDAYRDVGGRNLLLDSFNKPGQSTAGYVICSYNFAEHLIAGELYTISAKFVTSSEKLWVGFYHSGGTYAMTPWLPIRSDQTYVYTFTATESMASQTSGAGYGYCNAYASNNPNGAQSGMTIAGTAHVDWIKIEKGEHNTDWSPAPEDVTDYVDRAVASQVQATTSQFSQLSDRITSTVTRVDNIQNNMIDQADVNALIAAGNFATQSSVSQTASNLQISITQAQNTANAANSTAQLITTGVTVDANGVTVGKSNSAVKGVFTNNSLQFQSGGKAIAWLSANSEEGLGVDTIQIGKQNTANQRWIISTSSDGSHLSFTRHQ